MARTPDGPPPPPPVQRVRLRYAKRGRLRFSSHRDFQRALERAVRRAGVPVAYSAGFHPHPRISYANAAPTSAASEAEYIEIALARRVEPEVLRQALDDALPPGLDVVQAVEAGPGSLADRLEASIWRIELPGTREGDGGEHLARAVRAFLEADRVDVTRLTKSGRRTFDAREAVLDLVLDLDGHRGVLPAAGGGVEEPHGTLAASGASSPGERCAILQVVVRHTTPAVRPDDVLAALLAVADFAPPSPPLVTRLAQGPLSGTSGPVTDPLVAG